MMTDDGKAFRIKAENFVKLLNDGAKGALESSSLEARSSVPTFSIVPICQ